MTVRTSAGTVISISDDIPATFNEAGYEDVGVVFTAIGEVTDLGEFGREFALVTHNPVASRGTVKKKGSYNEGTMSLSLGLDTDDGGQVIAKAAAASDNNYSFRVVMPSGDYYYFQAQVMSFKVGVGSVDQITTATITLEITTSATGIGVVEVLA